MNEFFSVWKAVTVEILQQAEWVGQMSSEVILISFGIFWNANKLQLASQGLV